MLPLQTDDNGIINYNYSNQNLTQFNTYIDTNNNHNNIDLYSETLNHDNDDNNESPEFLFLKAFRQSKPATTVFNSNSNSNKSLKSAHYESFAAECAGTKNYSAMVASLVPLWVIFSVMIVLLLLTFHRNMKSAKVYDNCTKRNAHFVYHVELRTGDCSASYNMRRTTIMLDLFDENQTTLARLTIPGHLIFGRKEQPNSAIDDDRYLELRVTRFWLYRASRFKKINTIRVTHNCPDPDARIMVYGIEFRSNESDRYKTFFPVMNYISAYGATNKPNASFDVDFNGSISQLGGPWDDQTSMNPRLSGLDYCLFAHMTFSLCLLFSVVRLYPEKHIANSTSPTVASIYNGLSVGALVFLVVVCLALLFRFVLKEHFALSMGEGFWAYVYYCSYFSALGLSTSLWIYTIVNYYRYVCPLVYKQVTLSITFSLGESVLLSVIVYILTMLGINLTSQGVDPYIIHEVTNYDDPQYQEEKPSTSPSKNNSKNNYKSQTHNSRSRNVTPRRDHPSYPMKNNNQMPQETYNQLPQQQQQQAQQQLPQQDPFTRYKSIATAYTAMPLNGPAPIATPPTHLAPQTTPGQPLPSYHTQITTVGPKPLRRTGSQDSTGSNYYRQLMKNKGEVKSISQYGQMLRASKKTLAKKS